MPNGGTAQWLTFLLLDPATSGSIPSIKKIISKKILQKTTFAFQPPIVMNLTTMSVDDVTMYDDVINGTAASNVSNIYFSVKSNNSEFADCSQTILMDEIKVSEHSRDSNPEPLFSRTGFDYLRA